MLFFMKSAKNTARGEVKREAVPPRLAPGTVPRLPAKRCVAKAASGERCKSAPLRGKKRCGFHSGDTAKVLGARGGRRRAIFDPDNLTPLNPPKDAAELLVLLSQTIVEVRGAQIDTRAANSIAYLGTSFLRAAEVSDLEQRIRALEERGQKRDAEVRRLGVMNDGR